MAVAPDDGAPVSLAQRYGPHTVAAMSMDPAPISTSFATGRHDRSAAQAAKVSVTTMRAPTAVCRV